MHHEVGDNVSFTIDNSDGSHEVPAGDVLIVGVIGKIDADTQIASVVECWAVHQMWGPSAEGRGKVIETPVATLAPATERQTGIIDAVFLLDDDLQNVMDELASPVHP